MKYMIQLLNGQTRHAATMREARRVARQMLGSRVYYGAQYQSDREADPVTERRENCTDLDCWDTLRKAKQESGACADAVISWR